MKDFLDLFKISLKIYKDVTFLSLKQAISNWQTILIHFALLFVLFISSLVLQSNNLIFSLIRGLLFSYVLAIYLTTIRNISMKEKNNFKFIFSEAMPIFSNLLSVFFALMLINMVLKAVNNPLISNIFGIIFCVLANPLPEILYLRGGMLGEIVVSSFEFIKENFIEWFFPVFLLIFLFVGISPRTILTIFSENPLNLIESILISLTSLIFNLQFLIPILYVLMLVNLFRANLFKALEKGRRSRLYLSRQ
jgi:hypothetical protein